MSPVRRNLLTGVGGIALAVFAASALAQASNEWGVYGGDYGNTRYSTLNQINTGNVSRTERRLDPFAGIARVSAVDAADRQRDDVRHHIDRSEVRFRAGR